MLSKIGAHLQVNVIGYLALFVALSGTAWAVANIGSEQVIDNSLRSVDLKNNAGVRSVDVVDDTATRGGLHASDLAAEAVTLEEIAADAVGFSEIDAAAFNADIAEQGGVFGIPNDAVQGFEVQDGTLTGADIDESTLTGTVRGRGGANCCAIRAGILHTEDPYSATDPGTFFDLGAFELRSTATGEADKIVLCNPPGGVNFVASDIVYTGGQYSSAVESRTRTPLPPRDTCRTIDVNGSDTSGSGDFRMHLPERAWEATIVHGASLATGSGFTVFAMSISG
jgi:hypothetical protein